MNGTLNSRIHYYLTALTAFLMPVHPAAVAVATALLALNWLAGGHALQLAKRRPGRRHFFLFVALYALYAAGMIYTENVSHGLGDLETKLSLLIMPVVFYSTGGQSREQLSVVFPAFIYGCLVAALICLLQASYNYLHALYLISRNEDAWNYGINFFLKNRLSLWIHPSYRAMFFVFALALLHFGAPALLQAAAWKRYCLSVLLVAMILLFSSKSGMISLFAFGAFAMYEMLFRGKRYAAAAGLAGTAAAAFTLLYVSAPEFSGKINEAAGALFGESQPTNSQASTASRIELWNVAVDLAKTHLWSGSGTGDVRDELLAQYERRGMTFALEYRLNTHNQFLQTLVALGLPGLALLTAGILFPLFRLRNNRVYVTFLLLILLNFNAESMLETQAGVMFYAFFNALLAFSDTPGSRPTGKSPYFA